MRIHTLRQQQVLEIDPDRAWEFFATPANLNDLTPADLNFRITSPPAANIADGQIITYRIRLAPGLWVTWVTEIRCVMPGRCFVDEQRFGPYKFWHHRHEFEAVPEGVLVRDVVHYALPLGLLGEIVHRLFVRRKLAAIFQFRREVLAARFSGTEPDMLER